MTCDGGSLNEQTPGPHTIASSCEPRGGQETGADSCTNKCSEHGIGAQLGDLLGGWQLRTVALPTHQAQETEGTELVRTELVPGQRRHAHQIVLGQLVERLAHQAAAAAAQDHHRVRVRMTLKRRVAAGGDLEVAPLRVRGIFEQHLARDVPKRRLALLLVAQHRHAVPTAPGSGLAQHRFAHGAAAAPAARWAGNGAAARRTRSTNAVARASTDSPAVAAPPRRSPPISSITSVPNCWIISSTRSMRIPPAGTGSIAGKEPSGSRARAAIARHVSRSYEKRPPKLGKIVASAPNIRNKRPSNRAGAMRAIPAKAGCARIGTAACSRTSSTSVGTPVSIGHINTAPTPSSRTIRSCSARRRGPPDRVGAYSTRPAPRSARASSIARCTAAKIG